MKLPKRLKPRTNLNLLTLLTLSIALNYGQFSGWVTIKNPKESQAAGYNAAQRAAVDLLVMDDLSER